MMLASPVLFALHLKAAVGVDYSAGPFPAALAFDGTDIWGVNDTSCCSAGTMTKLLASTLATMGTYPVGDLPTTVVFGRASSSRVPRVTTR